MGKVKTTNAPRDDEVDCVDDNKSNNLETSVKGTPHTLELNHKKVKKRKLKLLTEPSKKPTKQNTDTSPNDADEEIREPTEAEIQESLRPENIKDVPTVRQKKKRKHEKRLEVQKDQVTTKEVQRNEEYLRKWKNSRKEWKFEKLRQISIQNAIFDENKVSKELWPIALEYLSGTQGAARGKITKSAETVIDELDKQVESGTDPSSITSSEKYRRARELLQSFG